jgi:hypothetical protein
VFKPFALGLSGLLIVHIWLIDEPQVIHHYLEENLFFRIPPKLGLGLELCKGAASLSSTRRSREFEALCGAEIPVETQSNGYVRLNSVHVWLQPSRNLNVELKRHPPPYSKSLSFHTPAECHTLQIVSPPPTILTLQGQTSHSHGFDFASLYSEPFLDFASE